jgi:hypothetical protein
MRSVAKDRPQQLSFASKFCPDRRDSVLSLRCSRIAHAGLTFWHHDFAAFAAIFKICVIIIDSGLV